VTSEFYDLAMVEEGAPSMLPLEQSPWLRVYEEAARFIPSGHDVVDLGCGTGRFAYHLLRETTFYGGYTGIDFSRAALDEAAKYTLEEDFRCEDLELWQPDAERSGHTTYVCLEVLEHLARDVDLVRRVPSGHQFVFSVPNYESESHLRWFRDAGQVVERYSLLLTFRRWSLIELDDRKVIHVWDTSRRTDSW